MIYGYVRVSTDDQNPERQLVKMKELGITTDNIFIDKESGKNFKRSMYISLKSVVKEGDEIFVKELDRLGRNKDEIKSELRWFKEHNVMCRILDIPTTLIDFGGQDWIREMVNNIIIEVLGAIAEQEREKIRTRQAEGIAIAKAEGKYKGRIPIKIDKTLFEQEYTRWKDGQITATAAMKNLGVKHNTFYRRVAAHESRFES